MGMLPDGAVVNHFLTDTDAFFIKTDAPNGFKYFNRAPIKTAMEGTSIQVICDSKHVSVIALVFLTGVVFSVHPEHKLCYSRGNQFHIDFPP